MSFFFLYIFVALLYFLNTSHHMNGIILFQQIIVFIILSDWNTISVDQGSWWYFDFNWFQNLLKCFFIDTVQLSHEINWNQLKTYEIHWNQLKSIEIRTVAISKKNFFWHRIMELKKKYLNMLKDYINAIPKELCTEVSKEYLVTQETISDKLNMEPIKYGGTK